VPRAKKTTKKVTKKTTRKTATTSRRVVVPPANLQVAVFRIRGNAPLVINAFSQKARQEIHDKQAAGSVAKKGKKRDKKDFKECFEQARHRTKAGWDGVPASAFRTALVSACRTVGFKMTLAKLSLFCVADGFDEVSHDPLVKITKGKPQYFEAAVRNATGVVDLRARPLWEPGWEAKVTLEFDADQFALEDVTNLLVRVGKQVGLGEGRPDSKNSCGMGWGTFDVLGAS
jgi:hypothetical protein